MGMCQTCYLSDYHKVRTYNSKLYMFRENASKTLTLQVQSQMLNLSKLILIISKTECFKAQLIQQMAVLPHLFHHKCLKTYKFKIQIKHYKFRWAAVATLRKMVVKRKELCLMAPIRWMK